MSGRWCCQAFFMEQAQTQQSRYERKRMEREERERERTTTQKKKKLARYGALAIVLAGIAGGIVLVAKRVNNQAAQVFGERIASQGQQHVDSVDVSRYNSVPPTSGDHFASQTNWGIHKEPVPEGYQIHNLEHGGVLVQYKPDLAPEIIEKLKAIGESYNWKKIILAPYPPLDTNIALTAWTYIDTFDVLDEARVRAFIDARRNHAPENVPDDMPSVVLP